MHPHTFIFFGQSGAGKGTQVQLLQKYLEQKKRNVLKIETGAKFRELLTSETLTGRQTKDRIGRGLLLPDFLAIALWGREIIEKITGKEDLILDGLARRPHEAQMLAGGMTFYNRHKPFVIYIKVSETWCTTRLTERGRADDTPNQIKKRLDWFNWNTVPSIAYFHENSNYNFIEINGEQSVENVHKEILEKTKLNI